MDSASSKPFLGQSHDLAQRGTRSDALLLGNAVNVLCMIDMTLQALPANLGEVRVTNAFLTWSLNPKALRMITLWAVRVKDVRLLRSVINAS